MNNVAHEQNTGVVPIRSGHGPGPALLPGIEGFYVLTTSGTFGRYQSDGQFREEPSLSERLAGEAAALLRRYRDGDLASITLGLVTRKTPDKPWHCASLVFSDAALKEVYKTSDDPAASPTAFQKRNKIKSVYRGMELILDTRKASQPDRPRFCPVLVVPEQDCEALSRRYGVSDVDAVNALEVLDLMAPLSPEQQRHAPLSRMVVEMSQLKIAPELRSAPDLKVVDNTDSPQPARGQTDAMQYHNPWEDEPQQRQVSFNDRDPVTYWLLAWFTPFNELNDLQRQFIARGHSITKKPAGTRLLERGSRDDVTLYLVEGTLELEAFDGKKMSIVGGTRRAHLPISQLRPHAFTVTAATSVTVIYVSQDMVREINRITTTYKSRPGIEVSEMDALPAVGGGIPYEPDCGRS